MMEKVNDFNPDLLIDFDDVSFIRGGRNLVGPLTWKVELDERWVVLGPNGAGKTTLMRLAGAEEFPSSGIAHIMGEQLGKTDMRDLRTMIGMSSSALANRIPTEEPVTWWFPQATPFLGGGARNTMTWISAMQTLYWSR